MKNVKLAIDKLARAGLISLYDVDGRPFLFLPTWDKHQTIRAKKSKYPDPPACNCMQMHADACKCSRNPIQYNPIQSESEYQSNILPEADEVDLGQEQEDVVIELVLNTGELYGVSRGDAEHWTELYPAVDVMQELRHMCGWLESNPTKRKTRAGINRFITNWLAKKQDGGGNKNAEHSGNTAEPRSTDRGIEYGVVL